MERVPGNEAQVESHSLGGGRGGLERQQSLGVFAKSSPRAPLRRGRLSAHWVSSGFQPSNLPRPPPCDRPEGRGRGGAAGADVIPAPGRKDMKRARLAGH